MSTDKQKLIRILQSSWRNWVRRINSEQEQFEMDLEERGDDEYEFKRFEQEIMNKAYSKRRVLARETYLAELGVVKRADRKEDVRYLTIPCHIVKPKCF